MKRNEKENIQVKMKKRKEKDSGKGEKKKRKKQVKVKRKGKWKGMGKESGQVKVKKEGKEKRKAGTQFPVRSLEEQKCQVKMKQKAERGEDAKGGARKKAKEAILYSMSVYESAKINTVVAVFVCTGKAKRNQRKI